MRAAVALHAVVEILDALLDVFAGHICNRVFMAAVAGVFLVVVVDMTGRTRRVVVAIEQEKLGMIECRGLPTVLLVALQAITCSRRMDAGSGGNVTRLAAIAWMSLAAARARRACGSGLSISGPW